MHHYITKYICNGKLYAESWIQINIFGLCFCLSRRVKPILTINEKNKGEMDELTR